MTQGRFASHLPRLALLAAAVLLALPGPVVAQDAAAARPGYSPYADRDYPTHVYFGDTHHHTEYSDDAFIAGNRLSPEQAYRLARGEEVVSSTGQHVKLSRPLDFLVISDHAEGLGVSMEMFKGENPALLADPTVARWVKAMKAGGREALEAKNEVVRALAENKLPASVKDPKLIVPIMRSVWKQYLQTAEQYNEPGRFTALIGFEWTSQPGGDNIHRNVIFRDGMDKAEKVLPFSAFQSEDPERLWDWMARYEQRTGGKVLAIPHNANMSNGRMFELVDFEGRPLTRNYAERRARWEVLQEIVQTKGNSETHPSLSPTDEFAGDMGIVGWEQGNMTLVPMTPEMRRTSYLRAGLERGLELEAQLGVNPFKFGFVGGSDIHTSLPTIEEDNYFGNQVNQEPHPGRWRQVVKQGHGRQRLGWQYLAAGYAAVWAKENTRAALWDAMERKETYATSGSRITVRFFGGWDFKPADARSRHVARAGYARGVPMGGDLPRPAASKAPTFLVAAMKDPLSGNLDRIQIIKGWLGKDGKAREKVYDVAWSDAGRRKRRRDGTIPPVGNTVDVATATWTDTIGAPDLAAEWTDPDFDPTQRAFYYARVLEIPTPRWTDYDAVRYGVKMAPEVPMTQQERAWSSPIWYTP